MKKLLLAIFAIFLLASCTPKDSFEFSYARPESVLPPIPVEESTTCVFDFIQNVDFDHESDSANFKFLEQSNPISIAFLDLSTDIPKSKGNNGQSELIKLRDDETSFLVAEAAPLESGTTIIYEIFKNENVAIWTKSYKIPFGGPPFGMISMGFCD
ncbi:hypothetical protein KKF38_01125 [Patescibacteria group bacterium]|nr:hypothetical protein [Patescibacteria group bacterium]